MTPEPLPDSARARDPWAPIAQRPVLPAVLGALFIAFSGILVRLANVEPATAAIFRCLYALPPLALLALLERRAYGPRPASQVGLAWLAGLFFAVDLELFHHTVAYVGAGLGTVLGNTQVILVGVLAWLLFGERMDGRTMAAVPIAMLGVVLISGVIGADAYGSDPLLGVITGLGTGLAYAGFLLVLRRGHADLRRPAGPLFDATLSATVGGVLIGLPLGEVDLVPSWPAHGWLVLLALSAQFVGWLLISVSLPRLPTALTSVVLTLQPVGAVVLASVLVAEAPSAVQLAGAACILAGLLLATIRRRPTPPAEFG
ncbi:MAG TPA: DMT family transporter [candidate division Zixibacteria bacterium]|nr:DMT family transporter [candidate division Zixibacteria bacterium]